MLDPQLLMRRLKPGQAPLQPVRSHRSHGSVRDQNQPKKQDKESGSFIRGRVRLHTENVILDELVVQSFR